MLVGFSKENLLSNRWIYSHTFDRRGKIMAFGADGQIYGYRGPAEMYWVIENDDLYFLDGNYQKAIRFDRSNFGFDQYTLDGDFVSQHPGLKARLTQSHDVESIGSISLAEAATSTAVIDEAQILPHLNADFDRSHPSEEMYRSPSIVGYELRNVSVVSRFGALLANNQFVDESCFNHPFFLCDRIIENQNGGYFYASQEPAPTLDRAVYACGGIYDNYYHWMMFVMAKIRPDVLRGINTIVTSKPLTEFQRTGLSIMRRKYKLNVVSLEDNARVRVRRLLVPHQVDTTGVEPHPAVMTVYKDLKEALLENVNHSPDKIYISRSDTRERRLLNEAKVEAMLAKEGFAIVSLRGKTLKEQITLLHHARIVISPHGAGLTNIGFCQPGAQILEFQNPAHINWCMRNIATIAKLSYGHLLGDLKNAANKDYVIDLDALKSVVGQMSL